MLVEPVQYCCTLVHFTVCYSGFDTDLHPTARRLGQVSSREKSSNHPLRDRERQAQSDRKFQEEKFAELRNLEVLRGRGQGSAKASSCRVAELISQLRAQVASLQVEREAARDANRQLSTSASTLLLQLNLRGLSSPWGPVEEQPRKNQKQSPPTRNSHHGVRRSSLNAFQHGNCL